MMRMKRLKNQVLCISASIDIENTNNRQQSEGPAPQRNDQNNNDEESEDDVARSGQNILFWIRYWSQNGCKRWKL